MSAPVFVDTNVLIYAVDQGDREKQAAAHFWRTELWKSRLGRISFQVLQEFYATVIRKAPEAREQARTEVLSLLSWRPLVVNAAILQSSWQIQDRYKLSFWDSLIVGAAKAASCSYLLSEDMQAGQDFGGLVVLNPFRCEPGEILDV